MGNLFESESDPSGKRNSSSNINEKSLFSSSELIQIESTRQKMIHPENKALFPSKLLFCAMETHSILSTPVNFEVFISTCTRSTKSTTLRCVWDLLYDSTNPQKSLQLQLYQLLTVLLELCGTNQSNLPSLITRLSNSIHRINNNGSVDNGSTEDHATITSNDQEYELLQQWTRQYGAHLPNVFETFFDSLCFGISHGSSLTRFSPPALSIPSEIVSVDELLPLALFHSMLQGAWKRLYSSSSDGLSFNRIAHHIIGYEVIFTFLLLFCI